MQWRRLSSLQVGCRQESVLQCVIRLRGLEVVMQPARLAEHALDTSRRGWPAQVLPRHLGERREPLRAAGREIFWQVVIWQVPPCVPQFICAAVRFAAQTHVYTGSRARCGTLVFL